MLCSRVTNICADFVLKHVVGIVMETAAAFLKDIRPLRASHKYKSSIPEFVANETVPLRHPWERNKNDGSLFYRRAFYGVDAVSVGPVNGTIGQCARDLDDSLTRFVSRGILLKGSHHFVHPSDTRRLVGRRPARGPIDLDSASPISRPRQFFFWEHV